MKKLCTIFAAVLLTATLWAQSPEKMSYQAVIRNNSDALVTNTQIGIEINIRQGSPTGPFVYTETQTPTTNASGLVSIEIGGGAGFDTINWTNGPYFIETKTAIAPPLTTYTITGTSQLLSVPFALHAKTAEIAINNDDADADPTNEIEMPLGGNNGQVLSTDGFGNYSWTDNTITSLPNGTAPGQTPRWEGTSWVVDNSIYNDGTNVGIGTSAPNAKLHVNGNISLSDQANHNGSARIIGHPTACVGNHGPLTIQAKSNVWSTNLATGGDLVLAAGDGNSSNPVSDNRMGEVYIRPGANTWGNGGSGNVVIQGATAVGSYVDRIFVNGSTGNVGFGTSAPTQKLDVAGNIKMSGAFMPDDVAGTAGQVLTSAGSGLPPTWTTPVVSTNIYNADGTLTGNRVVTQDVNTLAFTGSLVNAFSVDGTSLSVDAANHRVGIGTSTPTQILDVAGNIKMSGAFMPDDVAGTAGQVLTSAGSGLPPTWTTPVVSTNIYNADGTLTGNRVVTQDVNTLAFTGSSVNAFSVDGTSLSVDAANHRVGVGTTTPNAALQVNGNISLSDQPDHNGPARIIGHPTACVGNHGPLTIQAKSNVWSPYLASGGDLILAAGDGNSSNPVSDNRMGEVYIRPGANTYGGGGSGNVVIQGATAVGSYVDLIFVNGSTGNVGIGTSAPATKLHVNAVMRLEPLASAPVSASKGDMYFNGTTNKLMVYDGTTWQACW